MLFSGVKLGFGNFKIWEMSLGRWVEYRDGGSDYYVNELSRFDLLSNRGLKKDFKRWMI